MRRVHMIYYSSIIYTKYSLVYFLVLKLILIPWAGGQFSRHFAANITLQQDGGQHT